VNTAVVSCRPGPAIAAPPIRLHRPLWQRLGRAAEALWREARQRRRTAARERATRRVLATLDTRTLCDLGLSEFAPPPLRLSDLEIERMRW